ncbi:MarR family transcriptional regulator [Desulfovibrio sp. OttesenSCG-928-C06]|nr:MarR family transcriptional regulator [Desulfovibrio sp. OttesenSCG-928-C06]
MKEYNTGSIIALAASIREQANTLILNALSECGVNDLLPAHGMVLNALFQQGPIQMSTLAKAIGRKKNTVTGLINTLEERGYCRREPDLQDARAQLVALTEKGESIRAVQAKISESLVHQVWSGIKPDEQQVCVSTLQKILENLQGNGALKNL